mgnify:CR=1 FL=1
MKKMIAMLLALVMAMSLMACGKQNDSNANDNNDANTGDDQPAAKTTLVVGVSADYAPFEFMYPDENGNMVYGGIDISVGAVIAMECMFLAVGVESWGLPAQLLIPLMLVIGVVFGIIQGYCVGYLGIQPFIVTMAGMFFARGMTAVISTQQVSITSSSLMTELSMMKFNMPFEIGAYLNKKGKLMVPNVSIYVIIALLVLVATFFILRYTRFGRSLYAVGGNQQSAALMGLDVRRTRFNAHIFCSVLTSIGAICYVLNTMCGTTRQALGLEMDAISSAVIGGTLLTGGVGNVFGSFFGVLINGTISSLVKTNGKLSSSWPNVVTALLLCFFIVLQAIFAKVKARRS